MTILVVSNETPVNLDGFLDGSGALQFKHGSDELPNYEQTVEATHSTSSTIRVKLLDITGWTITATHEDGGTQTWSRGTSGYAYFDFTEEETSALTVSVEATDTSNPPQKKTRTLFVKPKPHQ